MLGNLKSCVCNRSSAARQEQPLPGVCLCNVSNCFLPRTMIMGCAMNIDQHRGWLVGNESVVLRYLRWPSQ